MDLVQFLRARLDEDAEAAEAARQQIAERTGGLASASERLDGASRWTVRPWLYSGRVEPSLGMSQTERVEIATTANGHIVRHDPARVLAEVDAKRQAVDHYEQVRTLTKDHEAYILAESAVLRQIQYMALPYADHPDYRQEWRP